MAFSLPLTNRTLGCLAERDHVFAEARRRRWEGGQVSDGFANQGLDACVERLPRTREHGAGRG